MKFGLIFFILFLTFSVFYNPVYCNEVSGFPVTVVDARGERVTLPAVPNRIISLAPSNTEMICALGLCSRLVGVTRFDNYPPEAALKQTVGGYDDFSLENIIALQPDLVLAIKGNPLDLLKSIEKLGYPVVAINPQSIDEVIDALRLIGRFTGCVTEAFELTCRMEKELVLVREKVSDALPKRVYVGALEPPYYAVGGNNFINENIQLAGGENVLSDSDNPWPVVSLEQILSKDPEIIFPGLSGPPFGSSDVNFILEKLRSHPVWSQVTAVKTGNLILIDPDLITRPGPRMIEGIKAFARAIHPERFIVNN